MTQKGTHTWDIVISYHRCPECGYIFENRDNWQAMKKISQKNLQCPRCKKEFIDKKPLRNNSLPFFGEPEKADFDWS